MPIVLFSGGYFRYHDNYPMGDSLSVSGTFPGSVPRASAAGSGNGSREILFGGVAEVVEPLRHDCPRSG
jgi:hypothetical protein